MINPFDNTPLFSIVCYEQGCFVSSTVQFSDGLSILCELCLVSCSVLQVETIGDAYCVAGGLHKESETHAVQIALMALKMMELSDEVTTPTGDVIRVSSTHCALRSLSPQLKRPSQSASLQQTTKFVEKLMLLVCLATEWVLGQCLLYIQNKSSSHALVRGNQCKCLWFYGKQHPALQFFSQKALKKDTQLVKVFKFPYLQCGQPGQESTDDCICNEIHNRLHRNAAFPDLAEAAGSEMNRLLLLIAGSHGVLGKKERVMISLLINNE